MDAIKLLKKQHDEVDALIKQIETAKDTETKRATFMTLADNLAAHVTIEEQIFYPAVVAKGTEHQLHEAVEEHLAVKRILADMVAMDETDQQFDAKLSVMKESLDHHNHEEEEDELFPKVEKLLDSEELATLGATMLEMFENEMASSPRNRVRLETAVAADVPAAAS